jgi:hypothetical protein
MRDPIEFAPVYVQAPAYGLMGNATVRYCRQERDEAHDRITVQLGAGEADEGRKRLIQSQPGAEK